MDDFDKDWIIGVLNGDSSTGVYDREKDCFRCLTEKEVKEIKDKLTENIKE